MGDVELWILPVNIESGQRQNSDSEACLCKAESQAAVKGGPAQDVHLACQQRERGEEFRRTAFDSVCLIQMLILLYGAISEEKSTGRISVIPQTLPADDTHILEILVPA